MTISKEALAIYLKNKKKPNPFNINAYCFDKQLAFIKDKSRFKTGVCSRRSGKTVSCAADLVDTAISRSNSVCLYITLSRINAKKIVWREILKILKVHNIKHRVDNTELSIEFDNGSIIYLSGAKDKSEIEKFRGLAVTLCYIDESQSFKKYIEELIDDVITPSLFDNNGTLCLIGTPAPVPSGYFYQCSHNHSWSNHSWTLFDNPFIQIKSGKTGKELLSEELKRRGVSIEDPKIQREFFAKWTVDSDSLVYKYKTEINHYDSVVQDHNWTYVIGVDIGFDDSDAIAVLGWNKYRKEVYLLEEKLSAHQDITTLANQINYFIKKYNPLKVVMDTGGLGKKIAQEINKRHDSQIVAAEKSRKFEYIELLNDSLRTGRFFAHKDSNFAQDCFLVEWDKDSSNLKISDRYHSDICDAVLYAYRECLHWLSEPEKPKLVPFTKQWSEAEEEEMEKIAERQANINKSGLDDFESY